MRPIAVLLFIASLLTACSTPPMPVEVGETQQDLVFCPARPDRWVDCNYDPNAYPGERLVFTGVNYSGCCAVLPWDIMFFDTNTAGNYGGSPLGAWNDQIYSVKSNVDRYGWFARDSGLNGPWASCGTHSQIPDLSTIGGVSSMIWTSP